MSQRTMTSTTDVVLRLVGESGEGTVSLGDLMVQMLGSMGLDIYTYQTFPAEIKGGTVMYQIRARSDVVLSHGDMADVLVVLNREGFELFGSGLRAGGVLLYDSEAFTPPPGGDRIELALPISTLARSEKEAVRHDIEGETLKRLPPPKNIVGLGALLRLVSAPLEPAERYINDLFGRKGEAIVRMNISALHTGARHVAEQIGDKAMPRVQPADRDVPTVTVTGSQMLAMGSIAAGLRFYAGYPITPATEVMEFLAKELPPYGGVVVQAEDEVAALAMALGGSYAGKKSMTATSGPGLGLMVEQINLAGQAELPIVIVDVQRGGASTGLPTKTSQGDLNLAIYGVHNESPRITMAVSSVEDSFWTTIEAFNLAEEFQCPVILLSDQALGTRRCTVPAPDTSGVRTVDRLEPTASELEGGYHRYRDTDTGISPIARPGTPGGAYTATGIEHDEKGEPGYTPDVAAAGKRKRFAKLDTLIARHGNEYHREWGDRGLVDVGVIAFGSTEGVIREAVGRAQEAGVRAAHLHLKLLNPLPVEVVREFMARCGHVLVVELNYSGQLAGWIRAHLDEPMNRFHKDVGVPFVAGEILEQIMDLAARPEEVRR